MSTSVKICQITFLSFLLVLLFVTSHDALIMDQYFVDETHVRLPVDENVSKDVEFVDIDGDGDPDALIANSAYYYPSDAEQSLLYINDGTGHFTDETEARLPEETYDTRASAVADFDNDGDYDIVMGSASGHPNQLWINDGSGYFTDVSSTNLPSLPGNAYMRPDAGDVDHDGDFDIILPGFGHPSVLLINDGSGVFVDETDIRLPSSGDDYDLTHDCAYIDFDRDNDLDIFEANRQANNRLLVNDGFGFFTDESDERIPSDSFRSHFGGFGDFNMDDQIDVIIANGLHQQDQIWMMYGNFYVDETDIRFPELNTSSNGSYVGDIDNDGWPDILFATGYSTSDEQNVLILNQGDGTFTDVTQERLPVMIDGTAFVAFGDVDDDGDLDIVSANKKEQNRLYINNGTPDIHAPQIFPPLVLKAMEIGPGPFPLYTHVLDYVSVNIGEVEVSLFYQINGQGDFVEVYMDWCGGELYKGEVPDQTVGRIISYYFQAVDRSGNVSIDPENAPLDTYYFYVGGRDNQNPLAL
jgi:hypothetical protein